MLKEKWVQAHPPFMSLYTALFVWKLGILGTPIAFTFVALAALVLTLQMIRLELCPNVSFWNALLIGIAILGWDPVQGVFRRSQSGLVLICLLTATWFLLRQGRRSGGDRNRHRDLVETGSRSHPSRAGTTASPGVLFRNTDDLVIGLAVLGLTSLQDYIDYFSVPTASLNDYAASRQCFAAWHSGTPKHHPVVHQAIWLLLLQ